MECVIPSRSIKVFSKMVQCLKKIGDDLYLEPKEDRLILRTLNQARSAYLGFNISMGFFESYNHNPRESAINFRVLLKPLASIFRSVLTVEKCSLRLDTIENRLVVDFLCKLGIKKTYKQTYEECDALEAVYSRESCSNKLVGRARMLLDIVSNFSPNTEEISFIPMKDKLCIKSFIDYEAMGDAATSPASKRPLLTELTVDQADFETYIVAGASSAGGGSASSSGSGGLEPEPITFSLKESKAFLAFCEAANVPVAIWFSGPSKPMLFSINFYNCYEADFVIATLVSGTQSSASATSSTSSTPVESAGKGPANGRSSTAGSRRADGTAHRHGISGSSQASMGNESESVSSFTSTVTSRTTTSTYSAHYGTGVVPSHGTPAVPAAAAAATGPVRSAPAGGADPKTLGLTTTPGRAGTKRKSSPVAAEESSAAAAAVARGVRGGDDDIDEGEFVEGTPPNSPQAHKKAKTARNIFQLPGKRQTAAEVYAQADVEVDDEERELAAAAERMEAEAIARRGGPAAVV